MSLEQGFEFALWFIPAFIVGIGFMLFWCIVVMERGVNWWKQYEKEKEALKK